VLAVFAWLQWRSGNRPSPELRWRKVVAFGIMVSGIYQMMFLLGISRTTSGNTALIICTIPLWTALLARTFIGERLNLAAWIGLLIGLSGTIVVALQNDDVGGADTSLTGNLCVLASAITWSACTVYSRPMLTQISPMQLSACAAVIALPIHWLAAGPWYAESVESLRTPTVWAVVAYSGILSSGLALPMWNFGVRHAGAAHASVVQNLIPVIAIVAAWQCRNETPTGPQIAGGALILSGLVVMRATREKTAKPSSEP
jgi:drug/metabolite transporter (DMT)-like permease